MARPSAELVLALALASALDRLLRTPAHAPAFRIGLSRALRDAQANSDRLVADGLIDPEASGYREWRGHVDRCRELGKGMDAITDPQLAALEDFAGWITERIADLHAEELREAWGAQAMGAAAGPMQ